MYSQKVIEKYITEAVVRADVELLFSRVANYSFPKILMTDCHLLENLPLPIQYITACWDILLNLHADYKEVKDRNICFSDETE